LTDLLTSDTEWRDGVQNIHEEAAGAVNVSIVTAPQGIQLVAASMLGDPEAMMLLQAIVDAGSWIKRAPRNKPVLCACCPRPVRRVTHRTAFGIAAPAVDSPGRALGFAFCDACGERPGELMVKATEALRRIWPDLRPVTITHGEGGHA
jgi:hypothetical protein